MNLTKRQGLEMYKLAKRLLHYAICLEDECERLGNKALKSPSNVTIREAKAKLTEVDGKAR